MTTYELEVVRGAFEHALKVGAPGLSEATRAAIVNNVTIRIYHQLNVKREPTKALDATLGSFLHLR
jgi:hypothetical protein